MEAATGVDWGDLAAFWAWARGLATDKAAASERVRRRIFCRKKMRKLEGVSRLSGLCFGGGLVCGLMQGAAYVVAEKVDKGTLQ